MALSAVSFSSAEMSAIWLPESSMYWSLINPAIGLMSEILLLARSRDCTLARSLMGLRSVI